MRHNRGTEGPMDFAWEKKERDVYAENSPFRTPWGAGSRTTSTSPNFPVPQHEAGPSSYPGGFLGASGQSNWNGRTDSMPAPELPDISMDSVDHELSPAKPTERPNSPPKAQAQNSSSESELGPLVPAYRRTSRKPSNQIKRRSRRAASAPIGEESTDDGTEGDTYRGPVALANHYTMHLNAPSSAPVPVSPFAPHLLLGYVRVFFNTALVLGFLYIIIVVIVTVRRDIQEKVETYTGANAAEIQHCASQYAENKCGPNMQIPHMKQFCDEWQQCMRRDASVVGRARVAAETLAEVVNGFVEPITWKTLGFSVSTLLLLVMALNASASFIRPQAPAEPQPQHMGAVPYAYPPQYAVMPPDWGRNWSEGQEEPGPRMIRASSEVPARGERSRSVRR